METMIPSNSAIGTDHQTPTEPNSIGNKSMHPTKKKKVRAKETIPEINPLFNAVKKPDVKILIPIKIKESAKTGNPSNTISNTFGSSVNTCKLD